MKLFVISCSDICNRMEEASCSVLKQSSACLFQRLYRSSTRPVVLEKCCHLEDNLLGQNLIQSIFVCVHPKDRKEVHLDGMFTWMCLIDTSLTVKHAFSFFQQKINTLRESVQQCMYYQTLWTKPQDLMRGKCTLFVLIRQNKYIHQGEKPQKC